MKLEISEEYEELATEWQYQMILILKSTLAKFDVSDDQAKEIAGEFAFDFAMLHDQEELKYNGNLYNPRICFYDFNETLFSSDEDSNLHEHALGSVRDAYQD